MTFDSSGRLRRAACAALCAILPAGAFAQQTAGPVVPRDLAAAFVSSMLPGDSSAPAVFTPDQVPPSLDGRALVPASMHVVGTVSAGQRAFVFATSPLSPDSALHIVALEYVQRKWPGIAMLRVGPVYAAQGGGFRPAPPTGPPTIFCHGSDEALIAAHRGPDAFTTVRIEILSPAPACTMDRMLVARGPVAMRPTSPLPIIYDPPNATNGMECSRASFPMRSETRLSTTLSPDSLVAHYGAQLEHQGWSAVMDAPSASREYTRFDSSGVKQFASLVIAASPDAPGCRRATLEITTERAR